MTKKLKPDAVMISELVTSAAIKTLPTVFNTAENIGRNVINSFGTKIVTPKNWYEKAIQKLEWENAGAQLDYWLNPMEHFNFETKEFEDFKPDTLLDLPEYKESKEMYKKNMFNTKEWPQVTILQAQEHY